MKQNNARKNERYLLFWPVFVLRYFLIEKWNPAEICHPIHCPLDDRIPFLEIFLIPYFLWYFCLAGVHLWLYFRGDPAFIRYSNYLILSTVLSTAVFLLYPSCQELRPEVFPRNNALSHAVAVLYRMDTSTNVFPSEHVIGSVGFFLAVNESLKPGRLLRIAAAAAACLTSAATVFLKQHSVMDVIAAVPVCLIARSFAFRRQSG